MYSLSVIVPVYNAEKYLNKTLESIAAQTVAGSMQIILVDDGSTDHSLEIIKEYQYYGDVIRNTRRLNGASKVNDDITISNQISIVSDPFASNNFHMMRYVTYMGSKWKITEVEVQYPRLILTLGGVYNG